MVKKTKESTSTTPIVFPLLLIDEREYDRCIEPEIVKDEKGLEDWLSELSSDSGNDLESLIADEQCSAHELVVGVGGDVNKKRIELVVHVSFSKRPKY